MLAAKFSSRLEARIQAKSARRRRHRRLPRTPQAPLTTSSSMGLLEYIPPRAVSSDTSPATEGFRREHGIRLHELSQSVAQHSWVRTFSLERPPTGSVISSSKLRLNKWSAPAASRSARRPTLRSLTSPSRLESRGIGYHGCLPPRRAAQLPASPPSSPTPRPSTTRPPASSKIG